MPILSRIEGPTDLKGLSYEELAELSQDCRDVIIKKMEYFKEGQSDKHTRDILGVLRVRGDKVDRAYIETWAERLDLSEVWQAILRRSTESQT